MTDDRDGDDLGQAIRQAWLERMIRATKEDQHEAGEITTAQLWQGATIAKLAPLPRGKK